METSISCYYFFYTSIIKSNKRNEHKQTFKKNPVRYYLLLLFSFMKIFVELEFVWRFSGVRENIFIVNKTHNIISFNKQKYLEKIEGKKPQNKSLVELGM